MKITIDDEVEIKIEFRADIEFYKSNLTESVKKLQTQSGKDIFYDGGSRLVNELLRPNRRIYHFDNTCSFG